MGLNESAGARAGKFGQTAPAATRLARVDTAGSTPKRKPKISKKQADSDVNILIEGDSSDNPAIDLVDDMVSFRQHPLQALDVFRKHVQGEGWRSYTDYIGARLFYPGWQDQLLNETINRPELREVIEELVRRRLEAESAWKLTPEQREVRRVTYTGWLESMVRKIGAESLPSFESRSSAQFLYYIVAQVFSRCYHQGVHISENDIRRIRARAKELEAKGQSLLLFPCHKSHADYISLVFAFFRLGLSMPTTVAGDNLNMAVVGPLIREVGALYIRRTNWSEDPLYGAFFQSLIDSILRRGINFQCFIEGTRSRTGKLLPPKFGILKYLLESILSGGVEDAWVLPISTQYDKVVEADTYATELLGKEKKKESLMSFLESSSVVSLKLGRVDIRFGEIWSLRSYVIEHLQLEHTTTFPIERPIESKDRLYLLRSLGYRILADINHASAVMPSALVGAVLLTTSERGTSREQLIERVKWLIHRVVEAGGQIGALPKRLSQITDTDVAAMADNAISVLGSDLVETDSRKLLETVYHPKDEFKLSYYRNQVVFLFVSEAIVCLALYTITKKDFSTKITYEELERKVKFLSVLLSGEFVYRPDGLETNLSETLQSLQKQEVISLGPDGREISLNIGRIQSGTPVFDFYCYLVWPFIDGYWSVSLSLFSIPPGASIRDRDFFKMAQMIARTLYAQGELKHSESLNQEMIKFAVQHFESQGVVKSEVDESTGFRMLSLAPKFVPRHGADGHILLEGPLYDVSEEIALSRNKHLRYNITQTITDRMLSLIQPVAASLVPAKI